MTSIRMAVRSVAALIVIAFLAGSGTVRAQTELSSLEDRDGILYAAGASTPFSGDVVQGPLSGQLVNGRRDGEWVHRHNEGWVDYRITFDAGERVVQNAFFEDGSPQRETYYRKGRFHGPFKQWDRHGTLRTHFIYEDGHMHGMQRIYATDGDILLSSEYADGTENGATIWWFGKDHKRWETHFDAGARTGTWTQYATDGSVLVRSEWADGRLISRSGNPHGLH